MCAPCSASSRRNAFGVLGNTLNSGSSTCSGRCENSCGQPSGATTFAVPWFCESAEGACNFVETIWCNDLFTQEDLHLHAPKFGS